MRLAIKDTWGLVMGSCDVPAAAWRQRVWAGEPLASVVNAIALDIRLTCGRAGYIWLSITDDSGRVRHELSLTNKACPGDTIRFAQGALMIEEPWWLDEQAVAPHGFE